MLEEMHDPVLNQPIFVKAMSSQVRALKNICVCSDVCGHFCYWYNVAQYYLSHLGRSSPLFEEENLSRCACIQNCSVLKSNLLAGIGQQNYKAPQYALKVFLGTCV